MLGCKGLKQKKCFVSHNKKITQGWVFTWKSDYFYLIHWLFFRVKRVHSDRICHFQAQSSQLNLLAKSETFDCIALTVMSLASPLWADIWV